MSPIFLAAVLLLTTAHVNANQDGAADICAKQGNCRDCLHAGPLCSWCNKKGYEGSRCDLHVIHREKCKGEFDDQKTQEQWIIEDRNLTEPHSKNDDLIVQLKPQRLSLKLRPGVKHTVPIQFRQAEDYPVDLYYLMDLSNSMSDDKEKLAKLGKELGDEMNKITRNFRLGFGSFVDKVVMPYVSMVPEKLQEPCTRCVPPYGFRNHLPLTDDTQRFVTEVQAANVSGNLDAPEGGFDAIMQAVVCEGEIAWRKNARRLLLFSTDAGFHYAGDGKLGGIVTPHDGQCHMRSNEYTHSDKLDYPSLSQINSKIQENKVNIIFAVTEDQESIYSKLANMLEGCSHGKLANDSSNVVSLVKEQYRQITSQIEMTYEIRKPNDPEKESSKQKDDETYIKVTFQSKCKDLSLAKPIETNKCNQIYVGDQVQFDAQIELKKCPKDPKDWKRVIQISPVGLNEKLVIDLEMVCACACESTPGERKSSECNGVGTYQCGICQCDDGHSGKSCECEDSNNSKVGEETCRAKGDSRLCSGRGECHCGQCRCNPRNTPTEVIEGPYCECDNFSCDRHNNKLCGGDDRGKCVCGKCSCNAGWTGADCSCATSDDRCKTANGICNGHGTCHCGKCICDQDFTGDTCSECPTCPGKCIEFKDCVECQAFPDNPGRRYDTKELCHENCDSQFMTIKSPLRDYDEEKGDKLCIFRDAQDCKITFVYREENGRYQVRAKDKECAEPVDILAIIIAVILGIVLIGLFLLLIWKLLTTIHDRREYAKFEDERQRGRFETGVNPIYKRAITTFKNPTYGGGR